MTPKEIKDIEQRIKGYLKETRLRDALKTLGNVTEGQMMYELSDRLKQIKNTYAYMLDYLTAGADDPQRDRMLNDLIAQTYNVLDSFKVWEGEKDTSTLYFSIRRFNRRQGGASSVSESIDRLAAARRKATSMSALFADASGASNSSDKIVESAENDLFNNIWTSFPLSRTDGATLVAFINDPDQPTVTASRMASALSLAVFEYADPRAIEALCDIYSANAGDESERGRRLAAIALVSLIIALYKYSDRKFETATLNRIEALKDISKWNGEVRLTFMELVRARDTERISRTMREEILPGMMSIKPEIDKKIRNSDNPELFDPTGINPEWEEWLRQSGIEDKLKELNDMQMEGSDVFMSTFAHLKNFPFFNEIINWFTPYSAEAPFLVNQITTKPDYQELQDIIGQLAFLCDSDKYSMLLSAEMIPEDKRELLIGQINGQREQMNEMKSSLQGITSQDMRRSDVQNVLRNLYRFVNLFRRKAEFYNIFNSSINLLDVKHLRESLEETDLLKLIGEFYFKHKYYPESLLAFTALDDMGEFDGTLYQKMGYANEKINRLDAAARYYEQADLLDNDSKWVKIHLVSVYRKLGRFDDAINVVNLLLGQYPDDAAIALTAGYTFIDADNYREAIKHLFKAEFLAPEDENVLRPIAWALFMIRDFDKASNYYNRILLNKPTSEDYLNMGHVALAKSQFKDAVNFYKLSIMNRNPDAKSFIDSLEKDRAHLERVGIPANVVHLIADAVMYDMENQKLPDESQHPF